VPADAGDTCTVREAVCEGGEQIATVAGWKQSQGVNPEGLKAVVRDKGYPSNAVLVELADLQVCSYCSEPEPGRRHWEGKKEEQGGGLAQPAADSRGELVAGGGREAGTEFRPLV
jgi:hypothetical protein